MMFRRQYASLTAFACAVLLVAAPANAQPAPDSNSVLILGSTVTGGASSLEAIKATALGFTVVVDSNAAWSGRSQADFASFRAIILGDPTCGTSPSHVAAADANKTTWGPAINGNVVIVGTDPALHGSDSQGGQVTTSGIAFAGDEPNKTGAYITLSCYYYNAASGTPVPVLDPFGSFTVVGQGGCPADSHIVASHPALTGLTDASLSNWGCSTHEGFVSWPADFLVLALSRDVPSTYVAGDGSSGAPYILARGETLVPAACGDGDLDPGEQCDDGNTANGDGCSAQCQTEIPTGPVCGDGVIEGSEACDDGNTTSGDGCSAACTIENADPSCTAAAASAATLWPPNHQMVPIAITGVTDPDGDPIDIAVTSITQDEPVWDSGEGAGNTSPDASVSPLAVRAERNGNPQSPGDGRVYHIGFTASDGAGGSCSAVVTVCVPHDKRPGASCVDGGALYSSIP